MNANQDNNLVVEIFSVELLQTGNSASGVIIADPGRAILPEPVWIVQIPLSSTRRLLVQHPELIASLVQLPDIVLLALLQ